MSLPPRLLTVIQFVAPVDDAVMSTREASALMISRGRTQTLQNVVADVAKTHRYVAQLEERLRHLERSSRDDAPIFAPDAILEMSPNASTAMNLPDPMYYNGITNTREQRPDIESADPTPSKIIKRHSFLSSTDGRVFNPNNERASHVSLSPKDGVDGMGTIGVTENSYGEGNSSVASFVKQVKDAVASRLSLPRQEATDPPWRDPRIAQHRHSAAESFVLPPRRAADQMMDIYWNEVHVLYPFLHRPRFTKMYHSLWTGEADKVTDHLIYCILNTIFAITCQIHKRYSPEEKTADAEIYIQRATRLLQVDVLAGASIELIQALLLMGQYLQSTELPRSCWTVTGLAIRTAQGLGLHLPRTSANLERQQERETARRLWHGCVFMDRMVSMTFGRPRVITRADALAVPFPASINDEYLSTEPGPDGVQPRGEPSLAEFYIQTLKLYVIQERTLFAMYSNDASDVKVTQSTRESLDNIDFNTILRIEASLKSWDEALPGYLKNIPLEYVYVNVRQDAHLEQAFGELNPNKTVPVLTVKTKEGHSPIVISQSVAILEFFEEAFVHRRPLLPPQTDLAGRAKVRELVGIVACDIQPPTNRRILQKIKKCGSSPSMEEWAREIMDAGLAAFDKLAKPCAGRYCYGDEITLADVVLVPAIGNAVRYGVDIAAYPTIHRISETLAENEAFKAGGWQNQADTPEEERLG
ncbi:hypothetical protein LTR47_011092 [Exophiala xenobiotica]|nr:hypothetical protein LTR41_011162 [Exophiala xenobiotica]KAK5215797.1 hypothetical protein LTR72_011153 [Exophiala xenobiotica]KAK5220833.1 hypothetical protein LTR47_011092 [Exophiala xenobiotica]KAK5245642.1 hypothetical protein LTS06_008943 [Exophiala xenobiotica]KAK5282996.1 hypothetical protein LTR40_002436 [Exophiala xenobiotica]